VFKESREAWKILRIHREDWGTLVQSPSPPLKNLRILLLSPRLKLTERKLSNQKPDLHNGDGFPGSILTIWLCLFAVFGRAAMEIKLVTIIIDGRMTLHVFPSMVSTLIGALAGTFFLSR